MKQMSVNERIRRIIWLKKMIVDEVDEYALQENHEIETNI